MPALAIGRGLMALAFIGPGLAHLIESVGRRATAAAAVAAVEVAAGVALALGWQARWIALAAGIFLVVDAFVAHAFWTAIPQEQRSQLLHFFKSIALAGAFLVLSDTKLPAPPSTKSAPRLRISVSSACCSAVFSPAKARSAMPPILPVTLLTAGLPVPSSASLPTRVRFSRLTARV
jgi:putative oxidoreductase